MRSTRLPSWSEALLGLDPTPVPPHVFSVDTRRLRHAQFESVTGGFELRSYRVVDLDGELFAPGPLGGPMHDTEPFRSALLKLQKTMPEFPPQACLVLPDAWLRLAVVEGEELPRAAAAREEVLRWKLQRIVPFRVEELRVRGVETKGHWRSENPRQVLLGFALDSLLRQLEGVFAHAGAHLGLISNESLSLLSGVQDTLRDIELGALAYISASGYSLSFALRGEPILHRFKALPQLAGDDPPRDFVSRDLKLTNVYLREHIDGPDVGRVVLVAPPELQERWSDWLGEAFELPVHAIRVEHLPFAAVPQAPLHEILTLFGAARQEVQ